MLAVDLGVVVPGCVDPGPGMKLSAQPTDMDVVAQIGRAYPRHTKVPMCHEEKHDIGAMLRRGRVDAVLDFQPRIDATVNSMRAADQLEIHSAA